MINRTIFYLLISCAICFFHPAIASAQKDLSPLMDKNDGMKPTIFNHTESINPGETIGIQGASFGSDPKVWLIQVKGDEKALKPQIQLPILTHSDMYVAAKIPEKIPQGLFAIWVMNGNQLS